jgi:hypothetical protein
MVSMDFSRSTNPDALGRVKQSMIRASYEVPEGAFFRELKVMYAISRTTWRMGIRFCLAE